MNIDDYVSAVHRELRDQTRDIRDSEKAALREHLQELPDEGVAKLGPADEYARTYRRERGLQIHRTRYVWRGVRTWVRILTVGAIIATGAAIGIGIWLARYEPLAVNFSSFGPVSRNGSGPCGTVQYSDQSTCTVQTGDKFFIEGDITNHSPFSVDLVAIPATQSMIIPARILGSPCDRSTLHAMQCPQLRLPIHIPAKSHYTVVIEYRIAARCIRPHGPADGGGFGNPNVNLKLDFIGGSRTLIAKWPGNVTFHFPTACESTVGAE